jgi:hypothetical protein
MADKAVANSHSEDTRSGTVTPPTLDIDECYALRKVYKDFGRAASSEEVVANEAKLSALLARREASLDLPTRIRHADGAVKQAEHNFATATDKLDRLAEELAKAQAALEAQQSRVKHCEDEVSSATLARAISGRQKME